MRSLGVRLAALGLLAGAAGAPAAPAAAAETVGTVAVPPGTSAETCTVDEVEVRYVLFRPAVHAERPAEEPKAAPPAVLLLSRGDQAALSGALLKAWLGFAERHGFVLAWTPAEGTPARQIADLKRVLGVLEDVVRKTAADPGRVSLAGFGHGACAAWDAAMRRPEKFRALVSVNGMALRHLYAPCGEVAAYVAHGQRARMPLAIEQGRATDQALQALRAGHVWREVKDAGDEVADYAEEMGRAAAWLARLEPRKEKAKTCEEILAERLALVRVRSAREAGMTPEEVKAVLGPPQGRTEAQGEPPEHALIWSQDLARKNMYAVFLETRGGREEAVRTAVQEKDEPLPRLTPAPRSGAGDAPGASGRAEEPRPESP